MPVKYLRWTMPCGETVNLRIAQLSDVGPDYSVIDAASSQNRLRHMLSVLQRTPFGGRPAIPELWDLMITFDGKEYRLWVYTRNWQGQASFLAGILAGQARLWKKRRKVRSAR